MRPAGAQGADTAETPVRMQGAAERGLPACDGGLPARARTRRVKVGGVSVGGGAPVAVQSMTNVPMRDAGAGPILDVAGNLAQIERLAAAGCEIARVAVPNRASVPAFSELAAQSPLPVVADVHFDAEIACSVAARGAAALRINPGNIGSTAQVDAVIEAAGQSGIPVRIGVNAGSLEDALAARDDLSQAQKLAASAVGFVEHFRARGFSDIVVSAKAHDVGTTVEAYRRLSAELSDVPLHLGVTEAGGLLQGTVKSAAGLGILLSEGIGDTLRVSLTADPVEEVAVAYMLLSAVGVRRAKPEIVSCPTCGRCRVDLVSLASEVEARLRQVDKPVRVAVMGCAVNGPGEAADADAGVACGAGEGLLFARGQRLHKVAGADIVDELMALVDEL